MTLASITVRNLDEGLKRRLPDAHGEDAGEGEDMVEGKHVIDGFSVFALFSYEYVK